MQTKTIKRLISNFAWVVLLIGAVSTVTADEAPGQGNSLLNPKFEALMNSIQNEKDSEKQIRILEAALQGGDLSVEETSIAHGMIAVAYCEGAFARTQQFEEKSKGKPGSRETAAMKEDFMESIKKSVEHYGIALSISPSSPMAYMNYWNRGFDHELLGDKQSALQDYDQVIRLNPGFMKGHLSRAHVLIQLGKLDLARAELDQAFRLAPYDPDVLNAKKALQALDKGPR